MIYWRDMEPFVVGHDKKGEPVAITAEQLKEHLLILGRTGSGKTNFLKLLVRHLSKEGQGFCLIDKQGPFFHDTLKWLALNRPRPMKDIIVITPNPKFVTPFNILATEGVDPTVIANIFVGGMLRTRRESNADEKPRLETMLTYIARALKDNGLTIADIHLLLAHTQPEVIDGLVGNIADDYIKGRLSGILLGMKPGEFLERIESVDNRFIRLRSNFFLRTMGLTEKNLDFAEIMEEGKIVLVNLQPIPGYFDDTQARVMGSLLTYSFYLAAMSRKRDAFGRIRPYFMVIDEASEFVSEDVARGLDQSRQKGLHWALATQYLKQLELESPRLLYSVIVNCTNKLLLNTSRDDAMLIISEMFTNLTDPVVKHRLRTPIFEPIPAYDVSVTYSLSESEGRDETQSKQRGVTFGEGKNKQHGESVEHGYSFQEGLNFNIGLNFGSGEDFTTNETKSVSKTRGRGKRKGIGVGRAFHQTFTEIEGEGRSFGTVKSKGKGKATGQFMNVLTGQVQSPQSSEAIVLTSSEGEGESIITSQFEGEAAISSLSQMKAIARGQGTTESIHYSEDESENQSEQKGISLGKGMGRHLNRGSSWGGGLSFITGENVTYGEQESDGENESQSVNMSKGESQTDSESRTVGKSVSKVPVTHYKERWVVTQEQLYPLEENLWRMADELNKMPKGAGFLKLSQKEVTEVYIPEAEDLYYSPRLVERFMTTVLKKCGIPAKKVDEIIKERQCQVLNGGNKALPFLRSNRRKLIEPKQTKGQQGRLAEPTTLDDFAEDENDGGN